MGSKGIHRVINIWGYNCGNCAEKVVGYQATRFASLYTLGSLRIQGGVLLAAHI